MVAHQLRCRSTAKRTQTCVSHDAVSLQSSLPLPRGQSLTLCSLAVIRDVRERGRDVEGVIKQWLGFVKPNYEKVSQGRIAL